MPLEYGSVARSVAGSTSTVGAGHPASSRSPNPTASLQAYVSRLRRALGRDALARSGDGYRLAVDDAAVDALLFERLAADGRDRLRAGDAGPASDGPASSIVDLTGERPRLLREGAIPAEELERVLEEPFDDAT